MKRMLSILLAAVLLTLHYPAAASVADSFRVIGDVDEDGEATILDATQIQRSLASLCTFSPLQSYLGDVDGSGGVSILDATIIQRALADISYDYYKYRLYTWRAKITSVSTPYTVTSSLTEGTSMAFHIDEVYHVIPSEYEVYVNGELLRQRSTNAHFTYTFAAAGNYAFTVIAYDPFGGSDSYSFEMTVKIKSKPPKVTSAVYNKNTEILSVIASGGTAPYQYQYIIRNDVSAQPPGQFVSSTDFEFTFDEDGTPILKCDFCDNSAVLIPTDLLTKTLTYTCEVQVRDANGNLSDVRKVAIRI